MRATARGLLFSILAILAGFVASTANGQGVIFLPGSISMPPATTPPACCSVTTSRPVSSSCGPGVATHPTLYYYPRSYYPYSYFSGYSAPRVNAPQTPSPPVYQPPPTMAYETFLTPAVLRFPAWKPPAVAAPELSNELKQTLAAVKLEKQPMALIKFVANHDPYIRAAAAESLGKEIAPSFAVPALVQALADEDPMVRERAAKSLGEIGPAAGDEAVEALVKRLSDDQDLVRKQAIEALGRMQAKAIGALMEALSSEKKTVQAGAGGALIRVGPRAVPALVERLNDKQLHVRYWAAYVLGEIGPSADGALPALADRDQQELDKDVRYYVTKAIAKINR